MDSEMFVGEQRFAEKKVLDFMEFFKEDTGPEEKFGKLQQYFKGMKATLNPNIPIAADEDIDAEENKKFDRNPPPKAEGESDDEEEEQEEEGSFQDNAPKKDSDEDSDEDSDDDDDDDDDESSDGDERPDIVKKDIFGSSLVQFSNIQKNDDNDETSPDFGKSIPTFTSMQNSKIENSKIEFKQGPPPKNTLLDRLNVSNHHNNLGNSLNKSSNLSFFGRAQSRDGPNGSSDNAFKKEEEKKQKEKREDEEDDDEEEDDDDEEEDDSEEDDDEEEKKNNIDHDHSKTQNTLLFGNWGETGPKGKPRKNWRPLEMSGVTNGLSSFTRLDNTQLINPFSVALKKIQIFSEND